MKYPIGIQSFDQIIQDGYVYVDKTALIYDMVRNGKVYFLSRPRRFGKSLLVSTLKAYFQGKKDLFHGLAISDMENEWAEYPVFHIDFNGVDATRPGELEAKIEGLISSWEEEYGDDPIYTTTGDRFRQVLKRACERHGRRAVVLIDEYDKPILDVLDITEVLGTDGMQCSLEDTNRQILKTFYSVFKAADEYLQFVLLTGVTKFSQVSVFSGFNQPADISMDRRYEALCGITESELYAYFEEPLKNLARRYGFSEEEMKAKLKRQYDGYHFSDEMTEIYNPFSILNTFASQRIDDYWFRSGTPSYLVRLLNHTEEDIDELTGRYYDPSEFVDYKADVEKPLPMIYQSGYLTIKDCNLRHNTFLLDFPNDEVRKGFLTMVASNYLKTKESPGGWTVEVVSALEQGNVESFRKLLTGFLADIPYAMRRKETERERERYFHYTFYLLMRMIGCYTVYTEKQQSEGRVDCIVEVPDYIYIFEFKLDGTAAEALEQIEAKGYAKPYMADSRKVYMLGVSFSSKTGTVEDWEVKSWSVS
ncbi:MAG: ATP-binding protein [Bacteroidales bacterium]|nr:ATP-binding protein [Bacteroidales bacterium]